MTILNVDRLRSAITADQELIFSGRELRSAAATPPRIAWRWASYDQEFGELGVRTVAVSVRVVRR